MKRLLLTLLLLSLSSIPAAAQNPTSKVIKRAGYVAGKRGDVFVNSSTGVPYACKSATCASNGTGWVSMDASSAVTSPGGSDTQVQFNDSSSFGGDAGLTYNKTTDVLTAAGAFRGPNGSNTAPTFGFSGETNTGQYLSSAATLAWTIAGTQRLSLTASALSTTNAAIVANNGYIYSNSVFFNRNNSGNYMLGASDDVGFGRAAANVGKVNNGNSNNQGGALVTGDAVGNRPTCSVTIRGALWVTQAGAGAGDIVQMCMKGTADTYAWRDVFTAP